MPRQRSPNRDISFEMWKGSKGKKPLVDIAHELGVKDTQIRKWKSQDKWEERLKGTLPKKPKSNVKKKSNVTNKKKVAKKEKSITEKVIEESNIEDTELTEKQYLFCMYYVKYWNATKAYQKAYQCSYNTANVEGCRHLANPSIKKEIDKLKEGIRNGIALESMAVIQKYIDIAFADITDFTRFGKEKRFVGVQDGEKIEAEVNFVEFKSSDEVDGTIISEVSQGKDGVKIKLADKMKALEKLEKYFDLIPDTWKRKIEEEKLQLEKQKIENANDPNEDLIDDWIEGVTDEEE